MPTPRLKKAETDPEVWLAHRKLRKKIASAKWYAKKKKREIQEQNEARRELEAQYQAKLQAQPYLWSLRDRAYWGAVLHHHIRGYPVRPDSVDPIEWCHWIEIVEARIRQTRDVELRDVAWARYVPWDDDLGFTKILRQLGLREVRDQVASPWMTGPKGVLLAGCIRRWGNTSGAVAMARAMVQTITVQPMATHIQTIQPGADTMYAPPAPTPTPHQKHHQPNDDIQRWIAQTLFPEPLMMSWYDSDDEEDWLREWNQQAKKEEEKSVCDDETNSLPSSLDRFVDDAFPIATTQPSSEAEPSEADDDSGTSEGSGSQNSDTDPQTPNVG